MNWREECVRLKKKDTESLSSLSSFPSLTFLTNIHWLSWSSNTTDVCNITNLKAEFPYTQKIADEALVFEIKSRGYRMKRGEEAKKSTCFNLYKRNRLEIFEKGDTNKKGKKNSDMGTGGSCLCGLLFRTWVEIKFNKVKLNKTM